MALQHDYQYKNQYRKQRKTWAEAGIKTSSNSDPTSGTINNYKIAYDYIHWLADINIIQPTWNYFFDYSIIKGTIVIHSNVNKPLNFNNIHGNYHKILFSNYISPSICEKMNGNFNDEYAHYYSTTKFNQQIILSEKITHIKLSPHFNQPIILTENLNVVYFGNFFNKPIILPESIIILHLGHSFNQPIQLNQNIKCLTFAGDFSHPLILPNGLLELKFQYDLNQSIILPDSLEYLMFPTGYEHQMNFPQSLVHLVINDYCPNIQILPNVTILDISDKQYIDILPNSIEYLVLSNHFDGPLNNLPSNIKSIAFEIKPIVEYSHTLNNLPDSVESIKLPIRHHNDIITKFPKNLHVIQSNEHYKPILENYKLMSGGNFIIRSFD